ncbi:MAG: tRNA (guanosine(37)-N1)-methyltransferase TrmD [Bacteriovoracaceae bacterium]|nr:tRNA (guanosine(37)-N1)-methyltransferase TrmD [Bacteriovoracaceae bacterium]
MATRIWIVTLFPSYFKPLAQEGVVARAFQEHIDLHLIDLRPFGRGDYQHVDDAPYGGGPGMIMRPDVLAAALQEIVRQGAYQPATPDLWPSHLKFTQHNFMRPTETGRRPLVVTYLTAGGRPFTAATAKAWAKQWQQADFVFLCGRYEGIDQRFIDHYVHQEISVGDFVLSGGEIAALAVLDATARWLPGVLHNAASLPNESFEQQLLEYPQYTRPAVFEETPVPPVLLSGNHAQIKTWQHQAAWERTRMQRPDLLPPAEK